MGIAKAQFNSILTNIFKTGNIIKLFSSMPSGDSEAGGVTVGEPYEILKGDFTVSGNVATSTNNMMLYLCETPEPGDGYAYGFGIYSGSSLLYFGEFTPPAMEIRYNSVPTIKRYDEEKGEGVKVTLTSVDV